MIKVSSLKIKKKDSPPFEANNNKKERVCPKETSLKGKYGNFKVPNLNANSFTKKWALSTKPIF